MDKVPEASSGLRKDKLCLPIVGGLILFSVVLGTTDLGYIKVSTDVRHVTTMHLPTIIASVLEGWPAGVFVGAIFGLTSMYMADSVMMQDPMVVLFPRLLVGLTPYLIYKWADDGSEYVRIGLAAVGGTLTNTFFVLGMGVVRGYLSMDSAVSIALLHGIPEVLAAVLIVIPATLLLRRVRNILNRSTD